MHEVVVLLPGRATVAPDGTFVGEATVTLIRGNPNVIVDTGDAWQREQVLDALAAAGISPADIEYVINTHGHLDHVGNNNLFPHATFLLDSDVARDGTYHVHDFKQGAFRIAAANSQSHINVIATPGHTDHDVSVIVDTPIGIVAIVGDLFEYAGDWVDNAWRRWSRDPVRQQSSRDAVLAVAAHVVPGHGGIFRVNHLSAG